MMYPFSHNLDKFPFCDQLTTNDDVFSFDMTRQNLRIFN